MLFFFVSYASCCFSISFGHKWKSATGDSEEATVRGRNVLLLATIWQGVGLRAQGSPGQRLIGNPRPTITQHFPAVWMSMFQDRPLLQEFYVLLLLVRRFFLFFSSITLSSWSPSPLGRSPLLFLSNITSAVKCLLVLSPFHMTHSSAQL